MITIKPSIIIYLFSPISIYLLKGNQINCLVLFTPYFAAEWCIYLTGTFQT